MKLLTNIDKMLSDRLDRMIRALINTFIYIGERCVTEAREKTPSEGSYQDRTGNLRNSLGYVVLYNGIVQGKKNITKLNEKLVEELMMKYNTGIVLIVVAGMNYAAYVEAKNYDVLTSAELYAEKLVPEMLHKLGFAA